MKHQEALQKLIDGIKLAYSRGTYTFEEAGELYISAKMFAPPPPPEKKEPIDKNKK